MKSAFGTLLLLPSVVFAGDGAPWLDACDLTDAKQIALLESEAMLVPTGLINRNIDGTWALVSSLLEEVPGSDPPKRLNPATKFYHQPAQSAGRSGVLIGPDVILTASHNPNVDPRQWKVVFGMYYRKPPGQGFCMLPDRQHIPNSNVFSATGEVIANTYGNYPVPADAIGPYDYLAYRIDRPAQRPFLRVRRSGQNAIGDAAVQIGHPFHLVGAKIDSSAQLFGVRSPLYVNGVPTLGDEYFGLLVNETHGLSGSSGSMIYNLTADYLEGVVASSGGCVGLVENGNALWEFNLDCPIHPYFVNMPISEIADPVGLPAYTLLAYPLDEVVHRAAINSIPSPSSTIYSLKAPSNASSPINWNVSVPPSAPAGPSLQISSSPTSGSLSPGSNVQVSIAAGVGSSCGEYDIPFTVRDISNGYLDIVNHHFEVGLTEFYARPEEGFEVRKILAPYDGVVKRYDLSNPRPSNVIIDVPPVPGFLTRVTQNGAMGNWSNVSKVIVLHPDSEGGAGSSIELRLDEAWAEAQPNGSMTSSSLRLNNRMPGNCAVTGSVERALTFIRGQEDFQRILDNQPLFPSPAGGATYGTSIVDVLTISDNFVVDKIGLVIGVADISPPDYVLGHLQVSLISPQGVSYLLWQSSGIPSAPYLGHESIVSGGLPATVATLTIDDATSPSPLGTSLSALNGTYSAGVWKVEVAADSQLGSYFASSFLAMWRIEFAGHAGP